MSEIPKFTPSQFIAVVNQTFEYALSEVVLVGEVASYKVNQGKWVFFDLKDKESSVSVFMAVWNLRIPLEDGMKVAVKGVPKLTKWGKFSFTAEAIKPVGEGSLKKAFELLKKKLAGEGLFDASRKRPIPDNLTRIGVISSIQAAGYADFIKITNARWGGMKVLVAHTQVQGIDAPDQIIRALQYFNEKSEVQMIAILRGGGSADDLACFNDEQLVRAIAASKIPVITGIGHEIDESLADLAADVRASTPSNAAEMLTKDRATELNRIVREVNQSRQIVMQEADKALVQNDKIVENLKNKLMESVNGAIMQNHDQLMRALNLVKTKYVEPMLTLNDNKIKECLNKILTEYDKLENNILQKLKLLEVLNPEKVLRQGYAILSGKVSPGNVVKITTFEKEIEAVIKTIKERV